MATTTLLTGANRGIGLALARRLSGRGDGVIAVCRRSSPELDSLRGVAGLEIVTGIDGTDPGAVAELARTVKGRRLDALLLNAGILRDDSLETLDFGDVEAQLAVNAVAPLRVARALLANLGRGGKIAFVTSRMGSIADNSSGGFYGYRMSKAALNAAGVSLARDLQGRGIAVALLHPGYVRTEMTAHQGSVDADEAARGLLARLDALTLATSGSFWHANGQPLPW